MAPRYDLLNHFLSANRDVGWRRATVEEARAGPGDRVLDVCTGTGDLALEWARSRGVGGAVVGTDFCEPMVRLGSGKVRREAADVRLSVADTLKLPFRDGAFGVVSVGFGIRNVADLGAGLREMARVVRRGGRVVVLEFTRPANPLFRFVYYVYFLLLLPLLGNLVSGSRQNAYGYLPRSVLSFPDRDRLARMMEEAGLRDVRVRDLSLGIVTVHTGVKP
ncbi:MAG: ubiquinone/menaquinone biosynthesis methyltransferase [Planctomycetes bacterium]|nr:ubiquinone/menaquinone biosynthesis methyltransferase [Planctomycetota bacterium]